eukprot:TRINITY_DN11633_c0_g1_i4.p1 TRINITY_DN11633_c0_g1~~TRINITY_DN11633_c0_g1_i4.p1  ORF type:complete len:130 (-),score=13.70 TRINITY_DN11633_c0_g1_i4:481-870(-)
MLGSRTQVRGAASRARPARRPQTTVCRATHKVSVEMLDGSKTDLQVEEGDSILDAMIDAGIDATYDCRMGVCMTCPARIAAGKVDQGNGMLSEDVQEKGYALLCVSSPLSDVTVQEITEAEILDEQLCA